MLSGEAAITPMLRRRPNPIAFPCNRIALAPAVPPGMHRRSELSHVGWYTTNESTERLSPANGDAQLP